MHPSGLLDQVDAYAGLGGIWDVVGQHRVFLDPALGWIVDIALGAVLPAHGVGRRSWQTLGERAHGTIGRGNEAVVDHEVSVPEKGFDAVVVRS
jgi:hypothetical protein